jgi:uncharacterized membrane protein
MDTFRGVAGPTNYSHPMGSRSGAAGLVLLVAMLSMGLMAGLFYAFDVSVMPGLARTGDQTFVTAMQQINAAIQNSVFGATFVGAFLLTATAAFLQHRNGARAAVRWILAALLLYVVALAITMGINVPLNDQLAAAGDPSRAVDIVAVRNNFEGLWEATNVVRTVACTLALACLGQALSLHGRRQAAGNGGG